MTTRYITSSGMGRINVTLQATSPDGLSIVDTLVIDSLNPIGIAPRRDMIEPESPTPRTLPTISSTRDGVRVNTTARIATAREQIERTRQAFATNLQEQLQTAREQIERTRQVPAINLQEQLQRATITNQIPNQVQTGTTGTGGTQPTNDRFDSSTIPTIEQI